MAKKYLSIEEAAAELGMDVEAVNRLRESQEIRGFSDRGTWKFKPEDVEELARRRQADSSPSVPILDDEALSGSGVMGEGSSVILADDGGSSVVLANDEGSSVVLGDEEEDDVGQQATVVRKSDDLLSKAASDSDVRLVLDDSLTTDSDPDVDIPLDSDSDSDVRLAGDKPAPKDSDSDVQLVDDGSDSDVKLVEEDAAATIALTSDSDSDVALVGDTDGDLAAQAAAKEGSGSDSDVKLIGADAQTDSDIALASMEEDDSGIALAPSDSGLGMDSGIALESAIDSGISLEADSGIALAAEEDSGITLDSPGDSGIALEALNEGQPSGGSGVLDETQFEIDGFDDSEFELKAGPGSSTSDTGVIVFDDDSGVDMHGATALRKSDDSELSGSEEFEFDDDLEVADDVVGEDDELDDMDVFDATDEDFADSFEAGESHADFIGHPGVAVQVQHEWGVGTFVGLFLTTTIMAICALVMFDFVRSMWAWSEPTGFTGKVMNMLGGLFKK